MARIHELVDLLKQAPDEVFVQPHNVPDPDAIASSFGLEQPLRAFGIEMFHSADLHTLGDEVACIDHHQYNGPQGYRFEDVRPDVGSCSAIIAQYYQEANQLSMADLRDYAHAFETVEIYGEIGFLRLENANDSLLGAASDIVITIAGVNVVVSYSIRDAGVKYSTRSVSPRVNAGALVRSIVDGYGIGGGHDSMAGGFIKHDGFPDDRSIDTFTRVRAIGFVEGSSGE